MSVRSRIALFEKNAAEGRLNSGGSDAPTHIVKRKSSNREIPKVNDVFSTQGPVGGHGKEIESRISPVTSNTPSRIDVIKKNPPLPPPKPKNLSSESQISMNPTLSRTPSIREVNSHSSQYPVERSNTVKDLVFAFDSSKSSAKSSRDSSPKIPYPTFSPYPTPLTKAPIPYAKPSTQHSPEMEPKNSSHYETARMNVFQEIIDTESSFCKDMTLLRQIYLVPGVQQGFFDGSDIKVLFGNLNQIITFSEKLCQLFQDQNTKDMIGHLFLDLRLEIEEVYTDYCKNNEAAISRATELHKDESIKFFLSRCDEQIKAQTTAWDLSSLLIKPTQRVLKYPLLLKELLKNTDPMHKDFTSLQQAQIEMAQIAENINTVKKRKDIVEKYVDPRKHHANVVRGFNKKIGRSALQLKQVTGFTELTVDQQYSLLEETFEKYQKLILQLKEEISGFPNEVKDYVQHEKQRAEQWSVVINVPSFTNENEAELSACLASMQYHQSWEKLLKEVDTVFQQKITPILSSLDAIMASFRDPTTIMKKRNAKLLDYDRVNGHRKNNEEVDKSLQESADIYTVLNDQLLDDLPKFLNLVRESIDIVLAHFSGIQSEFYRMVNEYVHKQMVSMQLFAVQSYQDIRIHHDQQISLDEFRNQFDEILILRKKEVGSLGKPVSRSLSVISNSPTKRLSSIRNKRVSLSYEDQTYSRHENRFDPFQVSPVSSKSVSPTKSIRMIYIGIFDVIYPYRSVNAHELNIQVGDEITLLQKGGIYGDDWWYGKVTKGVEINRNGWFPKQHVQIRSF